MIAKTIDLYEAFGLEKKEGYEGNLTVIGISPTEELGKKKRPAVLVIGGGGYEYVSDREMEPVAVQFMAQGYRPFLLKYTTKTAFPTPLLEAAMAMAFIRTHAEEYEVDEDHVCAVGFSAGGHLTAMLGNLFDAKELDVLKEKKALVRPDAIILAYAVLSTEKGLTHEGTTGIISGGDKKLRERLSMEKAVNKNSAPAFLWHTCGDDLVPVMHSVIYAEACLKAGVPVELHLFEKGWHGTSVANEETERSESRLPMIAPIRAWLPLCFTWLKGRGFKQMNI